MIRQNSPLLGKLFIIVNVFVEVFVHSTSAGDEAGEEWTTEPCDNRTRLQILGLFPYRESFWDGEYVIPAARLARDEINKNNTILPGFKLELIEVNSGCDRDRGVREFVSNALYNEHTPVAILGAGCSSSTIAIASIAGRDEVRLPQVSYGATSPILSLISSYPYFFRTVNSDAEGTSGAIISLFKHFRWKRYGILKVGFDKTWVQHSFSLRAGIHHIDDAEEVYSGSIGQPRDEGETLDDYFQFIDLNAIRSSNMRVGILVAGREASRDTMCYLYRHNLVYPRIIWILYDVCVLLNRSTDGYCNGTDTFQKAMEGSICLRYKVTTDNNTISVSGKTFDQYYGSYVKESRKYAAEKGDNYNSSLLNDWATLAYDSMWVLGQALHNTEERLSQFNLSLVNFTLGNSKISGMITEEIAEVSFAGASGQVTFDEAHKRELPILFIQPQRFGVLSTFGLYHPPMEWVSLPVNNTALLWSLDNPPSDQFPTEIMLAQTWAGVLMLLFSILGFVWNSFSMLINFHYQNFYLIKASSPVLNYMIFAGNNLLLLSGILLVISAIAEHDMVTFSILCQGKQWLFDLGLLLVLNTTLLKNWRIYRIFYSFKRKPGKLITDNAIIAASIGWVFINTTYHIVFTLVNKSNIVKKKLMPTKEDKLHQKMLVYCQPSNLISLFYIPHFVMSVTLCLLAFLIRQVYRKHFNDVKHKHFNNAKHIAIFFYATLPIFTICLALSDLLSPVNDVYNLTTVSLILECTAVYCIVFMCQSTLFVPKMLQLFRQLYSHR
ncbi:gamma-aminobutyric acid type B receptor subunit 2-like [Dysidea avara]|uniref:gamma-aminobutyric acid type B receptor subunit 2-like n=1 Tax=Dysidea avara TaxID=196820 RepID=UPI0033262B6B